MSASAQPQISSHGRMQEILPFTTILDFVAMILIQMIMKIRTGLQLLVLVQNYRFTKGMTGVEIFKKIMFETSSMCNYKDNLM